MFGLRMLVTMFVFLVFAMVSQDAEARGRRGCASCGSCSSGSCAAGTTCSGPNCGPACAPACNSGQNCGQAGCNAVALNMGGAGAAAGNFEGRPVLRVLTAPFLWLCNVHQNRVAIRQSRWN